jgi:hypothetical protein
VSCETAVIARCHPLTVHAAEKKNTMQAWTTKKAPRPKPGQTRTAQTAEGVRPAWARGRSQPRPRTLLRTMAIIRASQLAALLCGLWRRFTTACSRLWATRFFAIPGLACMAIAPLAQECAYAKIRRIRIALRLGKGQDEDPRSVHWGAFLAKKRCDTGGGACPSISVRSMCSMAPAWSWTADPLWKLQRVQTGSTSSGRK